MPADAPEVLRQCVQRIIQAGEGQFVAGGPPKVAELVSHMLLVAASHAVQAAAAAVQPALSGRAQLRLLGRLVADTMCASDQPDRAFAETIGRRLDRQAKSVRDAIAAIEVRAEQARVEVRAATAADDASFSGRLAAIDATEQDELELQWDEVYENMEGLEAPAAAAPAPAPAPAACVDDDLDACLQMGCPTIPPRMAQLLGDEGCRELQKSCAQAFGVREHQLTNIFLPMLVRKLLQDRAREAVAMTAIETECDEAWQSAERAEQELEMVQIDLRNEKLIAASLDRIVRDVCKGEEPSDLMWTRVRRDN